MEKETALCYVDTVEATGIDPTADWRDKVQAVTKRERQRAGRLTGRVWEALETTTLYGPNGPVKTLVSTDTSAITWDTAENPVVVAS